MKIMKKFVGLLLTMLMVLGMMTSVLAATATITGPSGNTAHTYEIYQIFTGDYADGVLSNIKWGSNANVIAANVGTPVEQSVLDALNAVNGKTESEKLAVITTYADLSGTAYATITSTTTTATVPTGYYLIKDQNGSLEGKDEAYTTYIVQVVGDITINPKSTKPTVDKQVLDETADAEAGATNGWGETADHAINESFQFKLIATLAADPDYAAYATYKLVFNDTMSAGVTFERIASVKINNTPITNYSSTATAGQKGGSWSLTIADIKAYGVDITNGATVEVIYNAHLNESAMITTATGTSTTNENKVDLEYSNNPNGTGMGKTPEDHVWVFTYQIDNTKVDGSNNNAALPNAGFRLYSDEACTNEIALIADNDLGGYRKAKTDETGVEMFSGTDGKFLIKGLDVGTYYLKETTTPAGYNTCENITVVISAAHSETENGTSNTVNLSQSQNIVNTIQNFTGATLPTTGGIGTTIFYILGAVFVAFAAVLLITKKRMNNQE